MSEFNIYCDESCHLPNDSADVMVLGALVCPTEKVRTVSVDLKAIKIRHGIQTTSEIKWTKVTESNLAFYQDVVTYFFDQDFLGYRAVVAKGKSQLDHQVFGQDHDTWYFKMYFLLLQHLLDSRHGFNIFIDVKDTRSQAKTKKLHDVLCNKNYDFDRRIIKSVKTVVSHDTPSLQITDLLTGALSYLHREMSSNSGKTSLIDLMKRKSGKSLERNTLLSERKFNLLVWNPQKQNADSNI